MNKLKKRTKKPKPLKKASNDNKMKRRIKEWGKKEYGFIKLNLIDFKPIWKSIVSFLTIFSFNLLIIILIDYYSESNSIMEKIADILDLNLLIRNGIIITVFLSIHYFLENGCFIKLLTQITILGLSIYFYNVGSSVYSLLLPNKEFGVIILDISFIYLELDYSVIANVIIVINAIFVIRTYIEYRVQNRKILNRS